MNGQGLLGLQCVALKEANRLLKAQDHDQAAGQKRKKAV